MKRYISVLLLTAVVIIVALFANIDSKSAEKEKIKVLLLPKYEMGFSGEDLPTEARYYYDEYLQDSTTYDIGDGQLYLKNGVALYATGTGKVNAATATMSVLTDPRFDFSKTYIISTGNADSAIEYGVLGDVFLITAAVDYDLGHHADAREIASSKDSTWFHDPSFDETAVVKLEPSLMDRVYKLIKNVPLETTKEARYYMKSSFYGANWAVRNPRVKRGTTITGDNSWKGYYGHKTALLEAETYNCLDPYATTETEEVAIALAAKRLGFLSRLIIIRGSTGLDIFSLGDTPESLWGDETSRQEDPIEATGIYPAACENNFAVGKVIIDAILDGSL